MTMDKNLTNQTIALAGLAQAVTLVQQIAKRGHADQEAMEVSIASTLKVDADDILDVYGGLAGLKMGLRQLERQLAEPRQVDPELARYASTLMYLEQSVMKQPAMTEAIGVAVKRAQASADEAGQVLNDDVCEALAYGYQQTLSQLKPKVIVSGEQRHLSEQHNGDRIRALLLAGVRSALLWRQAGGVRWKFLFIRAQLQHESRRLLDAIEAAKD
jgi:high frequency lysogenization protein